MTGDKHTKLCRDRAKAASARAEESRKAGVAALLKMAREIERIQPSISIRVLNAVALIEGDVTDGWSA